MLSGLLQTGPAAQTTDPTAGRDEAG
jgi:hypothetical protein